MSTRSFNELGEFHRSAGEKVHNGVASLSPEEVLDEWRNLQPNADAANEDAAAIQEAIEDLENGDTGIPFDEFDREFRARHNLPATGARTSQLKGHCHA